MRIFGIIIATIGLLVLVFWEDVKGYFFSAMTFLGLCTSCSSKKEPEPTKIAGGSTTLATEAIVTQIPPVDEGNTSTACENFSNHTASIPHLYANTSQNELVGTVMAENQPEYNAYGVWKKMQRVGVQLDNSALKMYAYREPYQYPTNVKLRSHSGCTPKDDVRNTLPSDYLGRTKNLPYVAPISNYANLGLVINLSGDLTHEAATYDLYQIQVKGHHAGLKARINGGAWLDMQMKTYEEYNARNVDFTELTGQTVGKDFVLDFTKDNGATIDRYNVVRNNAGGHFSVTSTLTRAQDGRVYVHTFQGDKFTPMTLGPFGYKEWGNYFDLGYLSGGNHYFQLRGETGYILDDALFVMV